MTLAAAIKRMLPFFAPDNLAQTQLRYAPPAGDTALLIIDVQRMYCDPITSPRGSLQTRKISGQIKRLTPAFRAAGIPAYVIYFDEENKPLKKVDFYKVKPSNDDYAVSKSTDSAFQSGELSTLLMAHRRKKLLVCGFNLSACVLKTVEDARKEGYEVTVISDLSGNDKMNNFAERALARMQEAGATIATSQDVLRSLR